MRRVMTLLAAAAIVGLAASAGQAYMLTLWNNPSDSPSGDSQFFGSNYAWWNGTNWNNPAATTQGAIWLNTGSGAVQVPNGTAVNMQLLVNDYDVAAATNGPFTMVNGWVEVAQLLVSDGTAAGDIVGAAGEYNIGPSAHLEVPGTYWTYVDSGGNEQDNHFSFQLYCWLGNYNTYAAAVAANSPAGYQQWAQNVSYPWSGHEGDMGPNSAVCLRNPAIVMTATATPEPSALLLAASGLPGLLAYAWRRCKS